MAALTEGDDPGGAASRECSGSVEAGYWRDFFDERGAHREFDGGHSRANAERLVFGEIRASCVADAQCREAPSEAYSFAEWRLRRVGLDYHVEVEAHFYRCPARIR
jgi:hypothetical protein